MKTTRYETTVTTTETTIVVTVKDTVQFWRGVMVCTFSSSKHSSNGALFKASQTGLGGGRIDVAHSEGMLRAAWRAAHETHKQIKLAPVDYARTNKNLAE